MFPEPGRVELREFEPEPVGAGDVAVRTHYTLLSSGTELIVLNKRYEPGTHWDRIFTFPVRPGYAAVGEVVEVGGDVEGLAVGDLVVLRGGHASLHVAPAHKCTRVPAGIEPRDAPWFALAKIALMGARAAQHALGQTVLVIGAGPIGQMAVRWAAAAGAGAVVVVDSVAPRLELARRGGATAVVASPIAEASDEVRRAVGEDGPDVVIDSTGNAQVFSSALALVRAHGRVVVLGDTGSPSSQHLTSDVIIRGLTIVGAHDSHSVPPAGWDGDRSLHSLFFHLVRTGRFSLDGLTTNTFDPHECEQAYQLADERRGDTLGILFDWTAR